MEKKREKWQAVSRAREITNLSGFSGQLLAEWQSRGCSVLCPDNKQQLVVNKVPLEKRAFYPEVNMETQEIRETSAALWRWQLDNIR